MGIHVTSYKTRKPLVSVSLELLLGQCPRIELVKLLFILTDFVTMAAPPSALPHCKELEKKVFNDPIHGHIRLHPLLVKIIDTPQFQRLRYIKQLGGNCFVYPGGSHSRFEHSIGVAHLAGKLVEKLQHDQPKLKITTEDVLCVKIAGLCHDLGHGPFSHVWGIKVIPGMREGKPEWEHEQGSLKMFDYLIEQNHLMEEFKKYDLSDKTDDIVFIKELIDPKEMSYRDKSTDSAKLIEDWPHKGRTVEKSFLYEIVANKRNKVDVDKWDYFKRDCHHLGLTCVFDIDRAMQFIRVLKPDGERLQICFRDKEARNIFQMFQTRELLHRHVYKHKTTRLIEDMLAKALILADQSGLFTIPTGRIDENGTVVEKKMSEFTDKPMYGPDEELYTNLTDHVFQLILSTSVSEEDSRESAKKLKEAKDILVKLQKRELYKFLGEVPLSSNLDTILQDFLKDSAITEEDVFLDEVSFDFGMKEKNPFDHIMFFPKHHDQDEEPEPDWIELADVSSFLPAKFKEIVVRFYCKNADKFDEAKSVFKKWAEKYRTQLRSKDKQGGATPDAENGQQHDEEKDNQSATPDKNGPGEKQLADPSRRKIQF
ncbi:deoxynucleoside triphosphate triphosphohydrolase SAMHD1-like isoform X2 [Halichondria panicea]|uniref:deoxynucleoside triphosphate triphosphohydrolase SAMHD1-like isoform X2 n=1 Tax=Halichondria panicea TaxID=6063 RepID=UPI00312B3235